MEFRVLGSMEVLADGSPLDLGPHKQRALLALLLIHANRVVTVDRILDELWGDDAEGKEKALWVYVSRLRSALEPDRVGRGKSSVLLTKDHGYELEVDDECVDSQRFETALASARTLIESDSAAAAASLRDALDLWRGRPYEDFAYDEFAQSEIRRLEELKLGAVQDRIEADLRCGRAGELIGELEKLHDEHPYRERPVAQLMLALYRAGRQADALRTFERFRRTIGEELGIEPTPELRRLEEQVLLHDSRIRLRRVGGRLEEDFPASTNPFKGLRMFGEDDGPDFFGRDRLVAQVIRRLEEGERLIGLVGPSGSGKSSLVRAGLIPAVRKGAVGASDKWLIAQMVPGADPMAELEAALLRASIDAPRSLIAQLEIPGSGLMRAALRILPDADTRLLLIIDQFEELFTLVDDEGERSAFLARLLTAVDDPHGRVVVVLTLRADFYEQPLAYPDFGGRLGRGIVNIVPMTPDELEEAAVKPAVRAGTAIEPSLLAALVSDVAGHSGALPAFQYTLTELFDRKVAGTLNLKAYRDMGGVHGALARRADDLFSGLAPDRQAAAKQLFLRLVVISEGNEWGRRRVPAAEILGLDIDAVAMETVIDTFTRHRLLTLDRDPVNGAPTIEVAHEALLVQWPRLRGWIESNRYDVGRHAALTSAMREWTEAGRDPDYLLTGSRLEGYERWAAQTDMRLTSGERALIDASIERCQQTERREAARVALEDRTARTARRRLWGLAVATIVLVGAAIGLLVVALATDPPRIALIGYSSGGPEGISDQVIFGYRAAALEHGFEEEIVYPLSDPAAQVDAFLSSGPDLVIMDNLALEAVLQLDPGELARNYPDVMFATLEPGFDGLFPGLPNTFVAEFEPEEGAFLAGVAAAMTSQTGIVGFLGGVPEGIDGFRAGFEAGVRFVDPGIEILSRYGLGPILAVYNDPALSETAAEALYDQGADVVFHVSGVGGRGIFAAADTGSTPARHLWGIGVDVDEFLVVDDPLRDHVLTSVVKRHDSAVEEVIRRFVAHELDPGTMTFSLESGGFDLSRSGGFLSGDVEAALADVRMRIASGEIIVPDAPDGPATAPPEADIEATLAFDGEECIVTGLGSPQFGDIVHIGIDNLSSSEVNVAVWKLVDGTTLDNLSRDGPFDYSELGGYYTAAWIEPGRTHALTFDVSLQGTWGVGCFYNAETFFSPLFSIAAP